MGRKSNKPRFVCGIDFGTTFTSVAFAHSSSPDEVKLVRIWPDGSVVNNDTAPYVPTEVSYIDPKTTPRRKLWGYEARKSTIGKDGVEPLKWFKLLFHETPLGNSSRGKIEDLVVSSFGNLSLRSSNILPSARTMSVSRTPLERTAKALKDLNLRPVDVVADFLSSVRELAVKAISNSYDKYFVAETKIEYILTIPAIWTDKAKALMVEAVEKALFGSHRFDFHLVSEPEAAAAYTFRAIQPHSLKIGQSIVVCDAGGGTCDLVSYEITSLIPLKVDESVSGTGDLCGSVYLDQGFESYIRQWLGDDLIDRMKPQSRRKMAKSFEDVKMQFGNSSDCFEVNVPGVPDDDDLRTYDGYHTMSTEDLKDIFDPVVDKIVNLVSQQVASLKKKGKPIEAILLVGGFGSSSYLKQRLEATRFNGLDIQVIQPVNARTAIVRGALIRGLDGSIVYTKKSRRHYGTSATTQYVEGQGLELHRFWYSAYDCFHVHGNMSWYIQKEAVIGDDYSVTFPFFQNIEIPEHGYLTNDDFIFHHQLMACDLDIAPEYEWENPEAFYDVCTVRSDLSAIPMSSFNVITNCAGDHFYEVNFELKLSVVGDVMNFELLFEGKRRGTVTAKFDTA